MSTINVQQEKSLMVSRTKAPGGEFRLEKDLALKIHDLMVRSRVLEERLIQMYKQNQGFFWIGGPGEEAFNVPLGLQIHTGQGLDHDYLHLHYRAAAILLAMGEDARNPMRQMKNTATDPYSGGRNFINHFSKREWNIVPITSTIETQYVTAIGTGLAQKRHGGSGITIVNGGDAGSAEGDFTSCLIWASRPGNELPILILVMNNQWGISTPARDQHGERHVSDRAEAFGIRTKSVNGNDVEESWFALQEALTYIRKERKPFAIEAAVSRLYGHSSATGANLATDEVDSLKVFEAKLEKNGVISRKQMDEIRNHYETEFRRLAKEVIHEPMPTPESIFDYFYYNQKGRIL